MLRTISQSAVLLVEGGADERFFSQFVDSDACEIVVAYGKRNCIDAIELAAFEGIRGILAIVDSDFDIFGEIDVKENIIFTDERDLEAILFLSGAFEKILSEFGSKIKVRKLRSQGFDLRQIVQEVAAVIGSLRYVSYRDGINLKFNDMEYAFVKVDKLECDKREMVNYIFSRSKIRCDNVESIIEIINGIIKEVDPRLLCCGHDLSVVLGRALRRKFGSVNAALTSKEFMERMLRIGYSYAEFVSTRIYQSILAWEKINNPYRCLPIGV